MRHKAQVELNFFEYSDSKRYYVEPNGVKYDKINSLRYDLILGTVSMKEFGIILNFRDKMITNDETILPMREEILIWCNEDQGYIFVCQRRYCILSGWQFF
jgi:hypothetical protein